MFTLILIFISFTIQAQIQATTGEGYTVKFNEKKGQWEYLTPVQAGENRTDAAALDPDTFKSFITANGEISSAELRAIYLSESPDSEVSTIVDTIYPERKKCNCTVCHWPSHCTWGSDCSFQRRVPCSWCCQ